jgi:hypothetical protein
LRLHAVVCGVLLLGGTGVGVLHFIDCPDACS